jgi:hypothetical protein
MKYKLINKKTNEEHLCDKVVVDGFDYYVSDEKIKLDEFYIDDTNAIRTATTECETYWTTRKSYKKVIATNNPSSIKLPKVVDINKWVNETISDLDDTLVSKTAKLCLTTGYKKSQETHPFSEDDMIEFLEWYKNHLVQYPTKDLLEIWKDKQIKTIYYE